MRPTPFWSLPGCRQYCDIFAAPCARPDGTLVALTPDVHATRRTIFGDNLINIREKSIGRLLIDEVCRLRIDMGCFDPTPPSPSPPRLRPVSAPSPPHPTKPFSAPRPPHPAKPSFAPAPPHPPCPYPARLRPTWPDSPGAVPASRARSSIHSTFFRCLASSSGASSCTFTTPAPSLPSRRCPSPQAYRRCARYAESRLSAGTRPRRD